MIFQRVAKHVAISRNVGAESLFYDNPKIIIENPNYRLTRRGGFLLSHPEPRADLFVDADDHVQRVRDRRVHCARLLDEVLLRETQGLF